jgi:transposase
MLLIDGTFSFATPFCACIFNKHSNALHFILEPGQGKSYKEIANVYQLSPRTVETYLNRIKARSGVSSKVKLQELMLQCK